MISVSHQSGPLDFEDPQERKKKMDHIGEKHSGNVHVLGLVIKLQLLFCSVKGGR